MAPDKPSDLAKSASTEEAAANGALDFAADVLNEHKGKLAIGVAATLGLMVYYGWRERRLAKEDPDAHQMHQRSKAIIKAAEAVHETGDTDAASKPARAASRPVKDALSR